MAHRQGFRGPMILRIHLKMSFFTFTKKHTDALAKVQWAWQKKGQSYFICGSSHQELNLGAYTWEFEIHRKATGKRHLLATHLFQCCSAVFRLLQRSFW